MIRFAMLVISLCMLTLAPLSIVTANNDSPGYDESHFKVELSFQDGDQSQAALTAAAGREFERADAMLNDIYNQVFLKHKNDQEFTDKFIAAELAWIAFRDAEMEAIFPKQDKQSAYGSVFPMSYCIVKAELTWDRVKQLNQWLEGFPEGEITAGSRGSKE